MAIIGLRITVRGLPQLRRTLIRIANTLQRVDVPLYRTRDQVFTAIEELFDSEASGARYPWAPWSKWTIRDREAKPPWSYYGKYPGPRENKIGQWMGEIRAALMQGFYPGFWRLTVGSALGGGSSTILHLGIRPGDGQHGRRFDVFVTGRPGKDLQPRQPPRPIYENVDVEAIVRQEFDRWIRQELPMMRFT